MLTHTLMNLAALFGFTTLVFLWLALYDQMKHPEPKHPVWVYAALPFGALHAIFYIWYAVRIGS